MGTANLYKITRAEREAAAKEGKTSRDIIREREQAARAATSKKKKSSSSKLNATPAAQAVIEAAAKAGDPKAQQILSGGSGQPSGGVYEPPSTKGFTEQKVNDTTTIYRITPEVKAERQRELEAQANVKGRVSTIDPGTRADLASGRLKFYETDNQGGRVEVTGDIKTLGGILVSPKISGVIEAANKEAEAEARRRIGSGISVKRRTTIRSKEGVELAALRDITGELRLTEPHPVVLEGVTKQVYPLATPTAATAITKLNEEIRREGIKVETQRATIGRSEPVIFYPGAPRGYVQSELEPKIAASPPVAEKVSPGLLLTNEGVYQREANKALQRQYDFFTSPGVERIKGVAKILSGGTLFKTAEIQTEKEKKERFEEFKTTGSDFLKKVEKLPLLPFREEIGKAAVGLTLLRGLKSGGIQLPAGELDKLPQPARFLTQKLLITKPLERSFEGQTAELALTGLLGGPILGGGAVSTAVDKTQVITRGFYGGVLSTEPGIKGLIDADLRMAKQVFSAEPEVGVFNPQFLEQTYSPFEPSGLVTLGFAAAGAGIRAIQVRQAKLAPLKEPKGIKYDRITSFKLKRLQPNKQPGATMIGKKGGVTQVKTIYQNQKTGVIIKPNQTPTTIYRGKAQGITSTKIVTGNKIQTILSRAKAGRTPGKVSIINSELINGKIIGTAKTSVIKTSLLGKTKVYSQTKSFSFKAPQLIKSEIQSVKFVGKPSVLITKSKRGLFQETRQGIYIRMKQTYKTGLFKRQDVYSVDRATIIRSEYTTASKLQASLGKVIKTSKGSSIQQFTIRKAPILKLGTEKSPITTTKVGPKTFDFTRGRVEFDFLKIKEPILFKKQTATGGEYPGVMAVQRARGAGTPALITSKGSSIYITRSDVLGTISKGVQKVVTGKRASVAASPLLTIKRPVISVAPLKPISTGNIINLFTRGAPAQVTIPQASVAGSLATASILSAVGMKEAQRQGETPAYIFKESQRLNQNNNLINLERYRLTEKNLLKERPRLIETTRLNEVNILKEIQKEREVTRQRRRVTQRPIQKQVQINETIQPGGIPTTIFSGLPDLLPPDKTTPKIPPVFYLPPDKKAPGIARRKRRGFFRGLREFKVATPQQLLYGLRGGKR